MIRLKIVPLNPNTEQQPSLPTIHNIGTVSDQSERLPINHKMTCPSQVPVDTQTGTMSSTVFLKSFVKIFFEALLTFVLPTSEHD